MLTAPYMHERHFTTCFFCNDSLKSSPYPADLQIGPEYLPNTNWMKLGHNREMKGNLNSEATKTKTKTFFGLLCFGGLEYKQRHVNVILNKCLQLSHEGRRGSKNSQKSVFYYLNCP